MNSLVLILTGLLASAAFASPADTNRPSTARDLITNIDLEKVNADGSAAELGGHPGRLMIDAAGDHMKQSFAGGLDWSYDCAFVRAALRGATFSSDRQR